MTHFKFVFLGQRTPQRIVMLGAERALVLKLVPSITVTGKLKGPTLAWICLVLTSDVNEARTHEANSVQNTSTC
jgi:hypothetical protein